MLTAGLALLAAAAAFAAVMAAEPTRPFTAPLDRWWLSVVTPWQARPLTRAGEVLSYLAGPWGGTVVVAILVVLLLWRRRIWTAVFLALAEACGSGASQLIKHLVERPRPPHPLVRADFGSFPSGHVITTTVVGLALVAVLSRPGRRVLPLTGVAVAAALMMGCRTYLRAHWLTDTFESVLVASGSRWSCGTCSPQPCAASSGCPGRSSGALGDPAALLPHHNLGGDGPGDDR